MISNLVIALAMAFAFRNAPANTASLVNPYANDPDAVLAGAKLFRIHCDKCHGDQGGGTRFAPFLRSPLIADASPGSIFWFLTNGDLKRGMPSFSRLTEQRRWQLVRYLQSLR